VRRLTGLSEPQPPAEAYFAPTWRRPAPPLAAGAGLHRAVWDLHWARPAAIAFDYSISQAAGAQSVLTPQGPLALPGRYDVVLTVDGVTQRTHLTLSQDPRATASAADLAASLDLSRAIAGDLVIARRGFGQMSAAHAGAISVVGKLKALPGQAALAARAEAIARATDQPGDGHGFLLASKTLAAIESDLEGADLAPNQPQVATRARVRGEIDARWSAWTALRDGELAALDADLLRAGVPPIAIPPDDQLPGAPADDGEDLP
jgi:hypothetical protein